MNLLNNISFAHGKVFQLRHVAIDKMDGSSEQYEPLLHTTGMQNCLITCFNAFSRRRTAPDRPVLLCSLAEGTGGALVVAIPANMQAGDAVTIVRQNSISGTIMDVPAQGIPVDAEAAPGQLVFLPDLPSTVSLWHSQRPIMIIWLISSLISLVLFAPLFMASGLFLAAEIAAVMGVIASVVQLCEQELASSNSTQHWASCLADQAKHLGFAVVLVCRGLGGMVRSCLPYHDSSARQPKNIFTTKQQSPTVCLPHCPCCSYSHGTGSSDQAGGHLWPGCLLPGRLHHWAESVGVVEDGL